MTIEVAYGPLNLIVNQPLTASNSAACWKQLAVLICIPQEEYGRCTPPSGPLWIIWLLTFHNRDATFAIVSGLAGAQLATGLVLVLGVANLIADGFSIAASNFLGTQAFAASLHRAATRW